ncbi:SufD family Fe-S cluster assembly protein, partial [Salmonella enterica subsp. enterica serovar Virginia]|nr:SufD family Fe-S cluster assembly protein [Salmonella enterica subsp. enterica serovar Virginia]
AALRIGPGELRGKDENEMGPVVSRAHQQKVLGYIDKGVSEGALLIGADCGAHTFPYVECRNNSAQLEHEATTSRIGEDQLFYCL